MNQLLSQIHDTYLERCTDSLSFKTLWPSIVKKFPPDIEGDCNPLPPVLLARYGGDLGLAVLWIVQSVLVRGMTAFLQQEGVLKMKVESLFSSETVGALAHTESPEDPVIIEENSLSGKKKYITGGLGADQILVTARKPGEEKVSHLYAVAAAELPDGSLQSLNLDVLQTVDHGVLMLRDFPLGGGFLLCDDGRILRRALRVWSIVERRLITTAVMALNAFLYREMNDIQDKHYKEEKVLDELIEMQHHYNSAEIAAARRGDRISPPQGDMETFSGVFARLQELAEGADVSSRLQQTYKDVSFFMKFLHRSRQ